MTRPIAAAWIYFAMQSSYGLVWIIKDLAFPDSNFHKHITVGAGVASFLTVLGWYWVFGWLLISAVARQHTRFRMSAPSSTRHLPFAGCQRDQKTTARSSACV